MVVSNRPCDGEPRVALWGRFETDRPGDLLRPLIYAALLRDRLPGVAIEPAAFLGPHVPPAARWGLPVEDLGSFGISRSGPFSSLADAIVVCGESGVASDAAFASTAGISLEDAQRRRPSAFFLEGPDREIRQDRPFIWSAVTVPVAFTSGEAPRVRSALDGCTLLSVRDETSRQRLLQTQFFGDIAVDPDPLLLAASLLEEPTLERRRGHLRRFGSFPFPPVRPVVIGVGALTAERAEQVGRELRGHDPLAAAVVALNLGPSSEEVVVRLGTALGQAVLLLPPEATASDVAATLSGASLVLAFDDDLALLARGLRVPVIRLLAEADTGKLPNGLEGVPVLPLADLASFLVSADLPSHDQLDPVPDAVFSSVGRHFDRIAELTLAGFRKTVGNGDPPVPSVEGEVQRLKRHVSLWRRCVEGLSERAGESRLRLAEAVQRAESEKQLLEAGRSEAAEESRSRKQDLASALAALEMTRTDLEWTRGEVHRVGAEKAHLLEEYDAASSGLAARRAESDRLSQDLASALAALEMSRTDLERTRGEVHLVSAERARLSVAHDAASSDLAALRNASEKLTAELEAALLDGAARREECRGLATELSAASGAIDTTRAELRRMAAESEALRTQLAEGGVSLATTRTEIARTEAELDVERRRRTELETERFGWDQFGAGAFSELTVLRDRLAVIVAERDEARARQDALAGEVADLRDSPDRPHGRLSTRFPVTGDGPGPSSRRRPVVRDRKT